MEESLLSKYLTTLGLDSLKINTISKKFHLLLHHSNNIFILNLLITLRKAQCLLIPIKAQRTPSLLLSQKQKIGCLDNKWKAKDLKQINLIS